MKILLRDQVLYFVLYVQIPPGFSSHPTSAHVYSTQTYSVLSCSLASTLVYYYADAEMGAALSFTNATLPSLLGARMLLNLKAAGEATRVRVMPSEAEHPKSRQLRRGGSHLRSRSKAGTEGDISEIRFA